MKKLLLSAALLSVVLGYSQTYSNPNGFRINEIIASPPNSDSVLQNNSDNSSLEDYLYDTDDTLEYFEFIGPPGTALPAGTYFISIDGDGASGDVGSNVGKIREVIDLSGQAFGNNGIIALVANVTFTAGSVDQDGATIAATTKIENPYATLLAASDANVITVEYTATPEWTDEETIGVPVNETLRRFTTSSVVVTANDIGYDGTFNDQSNNFMLINSATPPVKNSIIDTDEDGEFDTTGDHTSWTIYDSISVTDNDDADTSTTPAEKGEFAYGQIIFTENLAAGSTFLNYDDTLSTLVTLTDDANYIGRSSDGSGYTAETDWFATRLNTSPTAIPGWSKSSTTTKSSPASIAGGNVDTATYGNINAGQTVPPVLSSNDFSIDGGSVTAFQTANGDLTIGGVEVDATTVYALSGAKVANGGQTVDVSTLKTGVYIVQVEVNGVSTAETIVIK